MLYRLSYVRARVILARDGSASALRRQCGQGKACGRQNEEVIACRRLAGT